MPGSESRRRRRERGSSVWPSRSASQASRKAAERLGASIRYTNMRQGRNDCEASHASRKASKRIESSIGYSNMPQGRNDCKASHPASATCKRSLQPPGETYAGLSEPRVDESDLRKQIHASTWQTRNAFGNVPGL